MITTQSRDSVMIIGKISDQLMKYIMSKIMKYEQKLMKYEQSLL